MKLRLGLVLVGAWAAMACGNPPPPTQADAGTNDAGETPDAGHQNQPPVLMLETPAQGEVLSGEAAILSGTAPDDGETVQVEYSVDEGATWTAASVGADGKFSAELSLPELDYKPWRIQVRATDAQLLQANAPINVLVDTVGPVCDELAPKTGDFINLATPLPYMIKFAVSDGSGNIQNANITVSGYYVQETGPATISAGVASREMPPFMEESNKDELTFTINAEDGSGNACEHSVTIQYDRGAPHINYNGDTHFGPASITEAALYGTVDDRNATLSLDFGDGAGFRPVVNSNELWGINVPLIDEDNVKHDVVMRAVDAAGNETLKTWSVWVDRVAPVVTFTAPAADQEFNAQSFSGTSQVPVVWTITDGDNTVQREVSHNGGAWTPQTADTTTVTTSATDDGVTYTVQVRATDSLGNETVASRSFHVDRVAPTVTLDRTSNNNGRLAPRIATFTFSEPVDTASLTYTSTPALAAGQWSTDGKTHAFELVPDTVYDLKLAPGFTDAFGNAATAGAAAKFHTELFVPPSGTVLANDVINVAASADPDGAVTLIVSGSSNRLARLSPIDGKFVTGATITSVFGTRSTSATSWRTVLPDLSAERVHGFHTFSHSCLQLPGQPLNCSEGRQSGRLSAAPGTIDTALAGLIVVPPSVHEPAGLPSTGHIDGNKNYVRGSHSVPMSLLPWTVVPRSSEYWELLQPDPTGVLAQGYGCSCPLIGSCGCSARPVRNLTTAYAIPWSSTNGADAPYTFADISSVLTQGYRLYVFTSGTQRYEVCEQEQPQLCPIPCNVDKHHRSAAAAEGLKVALRHSGNQVLGARKVAGGVELLQRDLAAGCSGQWTVLGTAPQSTGATSWHPVMIGKSPSLLYAVNGQLITYTP